MDDVLSRLVAESDIRRVLADYARAIDRVDFELLRSCYHPDAVDEHGTTNYTGQTAASGYIGKHKRAFKRHMHLTLNALIEVDGDRATVESYFVASLVPQFGQQIIDWSFVSGLTDELPYRFPNYRVDAAICQTPVPLGA